MTIAFLEKEGGVGLLPMNEHTYGTAMKRKPCITGASLIREAGWVFYWHIA
jgi:hypothetical protein